MSGQERDMSSLSARDTGTSCVTAGARWVVRCVAGVVNETIDRRHMSINFDDHDFGVQTIAARYVIPRRGAVASPPLAVRIYTYARCLCKRLLSFRERLMPF